MKKLALILALLFLLSLLPQKTLVFFDGVGSYSFYVGNASSTCEIITVSSEKASKVKSSLKKVCGESLQTENADYLSETLKRLKAVFLFEEKVEGVSCKYYYSSEISTYKTINGKKVNLQTAERENSFTIGTPIIFGSF